MRGEKNLTNASCRAAIGSPPRARGEGVLTVGGVTVTRITPACAGRRSLHNPQSAPSRDHPRVRGEKCSRVSHNALAAGSPPRARGEVYPTDAPEDVQGITPACAGRRASMQFKLASVMDHPRVRGEKLARIRAARLDLGSPPRARGEDLESSRRPAASGITPACAGRRLKKSPI